MSDFQFMKDGSAILLFATCLAFAISSEAQTPYTPDVGNVGLPDNGVFHGGSVDTIQLNNGNLHIDIPLLHLPGIGMDTDIHLTYDSQIWNQASGPISSTNSTVWTLVTMSRLPWQRKDPLAGYLKRGQHTLQWNCAQITGNQNEGGGTNTDIDFMSFTDDDGTAHPLPVSGLLPSGTALLCNVNGVTGTWPKLDTTNDSNHGYYPVYSVDQSGYNLVVDDNANPVKFIDKHGDKYTFATSPGSGSASSLPVPLAATPVSCQGSGCGSIYNPAGATNINYLTLTSVEDTNGNKITGNTSSNSLVLVDTAGRQIAETFTPSSSCPAVPSSPPLLPLSSDSDAPPPNSIQYVDQNGATQTITICYGLASVSLAAICGTNAECGSEFNQSSTSGAILVPTSVTLQNGDQYIFSYTPNSGDSDSMGELTSITLPTGGTISYTYGGTSGNGTVANPIGGLFAGRQVLTRTVSDGRESSVWTYRYDNLGTSPAGTVTVTDPYGNDTQYTCASLPTGITGSVSLSAPCYMTQEVIYNGSYLSQNPVATKTTSYTLVGASVMPTSEKLQWSSSNEVTETDTSWDTFTPPISGSSYWIPNLERYATNLTLGNTMSKIVYDYGVGAHGALISNTQYSYLHQNNSAYVGVNMLDRPAQVSVYNSATVGSSTLVSQATTTYDAFNQTSQNGQSGLKSTSGTTQHDYTNYSTSTTLRGLPSSVTKYTGPSTAAITTYTDYNDLGKPTVTTDGNGYPTTYTYGTQNAFLTLTTMPSTNGVAHTIPVNYDVNTGLMMWQKDQNGNQTSYTYDSRMRPLTITRPPNMGSNLGGGTTTNTYPDPNHVNSVVTLDGSRSTTTLITLDGLGRKITANSTSDASCGPLTVNTFYDMMGRVQAVSNPHCAASQATDGYTSYTYDALSRLSNKLNPDGSSQNWSFNGNTIDFYDETGRHWQHTYDAADWLTKVLEPDGSTTINAAPSMETDYTYDTLGNLLRVDQWGGASGSGNDHIRQFAYDALSRLVASNNPEGASSTNPPAQSCSGTTSGTVWTGCYSYDNNSNLTAKKDNRGISINYSYDALNRLTGKTYLDSTPSVSFTYDSSSISGSSNYVGELTQATVTTGSTTLAKTSTYSYDSMGRLLSEQQCTPTNCGGTPYQLGYTYDYAGKPLTNSFPSNVNNSGQALLLTYSYDNAERLLSAASNWQSSIDSKHPGTLLQASSNAAAPGYGPMGLQNASLGINSNYGTTTATLQRAYDNRSRVVNGVYMAGATSLGGSASTGSITVAGTEAQVTKTNTPGSATISFSLQGYGSTYQQCQYVWVLVNGIETYQYQCSNQPNYGSVTVTVQTSTPFSATVNWVSSSSVAYATALANAASTIATGLNMSGSPVTAVANSNGTVTVTARSTGVNSNYPVAVTSVSSYQ